MTDIKWQEPPADARRVGKWEAVAEELRARPNEWALVHTGAAAAVRSIKTGQYRGMTPGDFEAVGRSRPDGKTDVYARFVGESA